MQRLNSLARLPPAQNFKNIYRPTPRDYAKMSAPSAAETDTQAEAVANTSGITTESLQKTITEKLEAKHVDIDDMSGTQMNWYFSEIGVIDHRQAGVANRSKP